MSERWGKFLQILLAFVFAGLFVIWADWRYGRVTTPQTVVKVERDTLIVYDTITAYKPVPFNVYVVDTLYIPVAVPGQHDTVWAALPWEEKEYRDTSYRAIVSGFRPSLEEIEVYQRTQTVTVKETVQLPAPRWSWGIQTGVGYSPSGGFTPYLGVGIQYRLGELHF
jgi:hypothetical protein